MRSVFELSDARSLEFGDSIFRKVTDELLVKKPDVLLIPGDLTKDGERVGTKPWLSFWVVLRLQALK